MPRELKKAKKAAVAVAENINWGDAAPAPIPIPVPAPPVFAEPRPNKGRLNPAYDRAKFPAWAGFVRLDLNSRIKQGMWLIPNRRPPRIGEEFTYDPEKTIKEFKIDGGGDYDEYWVYFKAPPGVVDEPDKPMYVSKVKPLPLP